MNEHGSESQQELGSNGSVSKEEIQPLVRLTDDSLTYESIKSAIYLQMKLLYDNGVRATYLKLSPDIYEILNNRLVFKTPAHKELAHFITPYGNLLVSNDLKTVAKPRSFVIE
jgi:hypothetical protein